MSELLALEWGEDAVCGLAAQVSPGRVRVLKEFVCKRGDDADLSEPAKAGAWLKAELEQQGIKATQVAITLPRESAIIRRLELPDSPEGEWPLLVRFQASSKSSIPLDELSLDFLPLPRGAEAGVPVLAATAPRKTIEGLRDMCAAAGLRLQGIGLTAVVAGELLARGPAADAGATATETAKLLILRGSKRVLLALYQNHALLFAHAARLPDTDEAEPGSAVAAEFARAIVAARNSYPRLQIDQAWLLGSVDASLAEAVRKRLHCELQAFEPRSGVDWPSGQPADLAAFAGPLGALLAASGTNTPALDFLSPRQPPPPTNTARKRAIIIGAAAAAVVLLLCVGYFYELRRLSASVTQLEKMDRDLATLLKRGEPTMKSAGAIQEWVDRRVSWLEELRELQDNFPGNDRMYVTSLRCEPQTGNARGRIKFEGLSSDREAVIFWVQNLIAEHDHYRVNGHNTNKAGEDSRYPWHFETELMLMPETRETPAAKPAPAARVASPAAPRPKGAPAATAKQKEAT